MFSLRTFFYVMFALVAAPLEAWSYLLNGLATRSDDLYNYPWSHGLIYVLTILFFAETLFRIADNWEQSSGAFLIKIITIVSTVGLFGFLGLYLLTERINIISNHDLFDSNGTIQNIGCAVSFLCSALSFALLERRSKEPVKEK